MILLLVAVLAARDDAALAGAAYREALEAVRERRYDDAVAKLQEAVRYEPRETDKLLYRDRDGRHKEAYYPHYVWAQARSLQARTEANPVRQRQGYREALTHLELTGHPGAAQALAAVKADLVAVEKVASTPVTEDTALAAVRRNVRDLCDQEQFQEAVKLLSVHQALLDRFPADRDQLADVVRSHRRTVLERYEKSLLLALETAAAGAPLDKPDSLPVLLQPALIPRTVCDPPEARFEWLRRFLSALDGQLPTLRSVSETPTEDLLACAKVFEEEAGRALEAGLPAGFRAAMNIAHAVRSSRIQALADGRDDAALARILTEFEECAGRTVKVVAGRPDLAGLLQSHAAKLKESRGLLLARTALREKLDRWMARAVRTLGDPAAMADPAALRAVARDSSPIEEDAAWGALPATLRARALLAHGQLEAVSLILEGEPLPPSAVPRLRIARVLDAVAFDTWEAGLSPKLRTWLGRLDR